MKISDYQKLPANVRELFNSYDNNHFDNHPDVVSARRSVDETEAALQKAIAIRTPFAARRTALETRLEQTKAELQTQRETRQKAVIAALVADRKIPAADDDVDHLVEIIEALPGAIEVIEKEYSAADQVAQRAADLAADAASALKRTIERLKLEKAKSESY
jgi:chromosome segregation ATPase